MKRDMDLIRAMILAVESANTGWASQILEIPGFTPQQIAYHTYLLVNGGLAVGANNVGAKSTGPECLLTHLTWAGHEFADLSRNAAIWNEVFSKAKPHVESLPFDVLTQLLRAAMHRAVGLPVPRTSLTWPAKPRAATPSPL